MSDSERNFKVLGVDLAAQADKTALCTIKISNGIPEIEDHQKPADDKTLLDAFGDPLVRRIGIDSPFGWPVGFVSALHDYRSFHRWPLNNPDVYPERITSASEYLDLKYRATDLHVWHLGRKPLSVAVDSLGAVAIRNASLLSRATAKKGLRVDRSGRSGCFVEVYPAVALKLWKLVHTGYKGSEDKHKSAREKIIKKMIKGLDLPTDWLGSFREDCINSDDTLDGLVSAIIALMVELDRRQPGQDPLVQPIPRGMEDLAKMEGWIALPERDFPEGHPPKKSSLERLKARLQELP